MSYSFSSASDRLTPGSAITVPATSGSIAVWHYPTYVSTDGAEHNLFDVRNSGSNNYFTLIKFSDNKLYFGWVTSSVDYRVVVNSGSYTLNQNAWNCFVMTWDTASGAHVTTVYLNGTQIGTNSVSLSTWSTSGRNCIIGNADPSYNTLANGKVAEVALFDFVLSSSEITAISDGCIALSLKALPVYYWPLFDLQDPVAQKTLTATGATVSTDHPRICSLTRVRPFGLAQAVSTTHYLDFESGDDTNDGSNFANRWKTTAALTDTRLAPGDTIRVKKSPDPTSIGSATWTNNSRTVTLAGALTANIERCESAWTAASNVTASTTTGREGTNAITLVIASAFTTGIAGYKAMSSTDFSAYKQISFYIQTSVAFVAGIFQLRLCSDTVGATPVNTVTIPAINRTGQWIPITVDTGGALGSAIQSVSLYTLYDIGAVTITLDNIIACKDSTSADSLSLRSLISKNNGTDAWHAITSINGTTVTIDSGAYAGTTETATTYKRDPFTVTVAQTITITVGTAVSGIAIAGGYDSTSMSTRDGDTFLDFATASGNAITISSTSAYLTMSHVGVSRSTVNYNISSSIGIYTDIYSAGTYNTNFSVLGGSNSFTGLYLAGTSTGCSLGGSSNNFDTVVCSTTGQGFSITGSNNRLDNVVINGCTNGLAISGHVHLRDCAISNCSTTGLSFSNGAPSFLSNVTTTGNTVAMTTNLIVTNLYNCTINESTEVTFTASYGDGRVQSTKHDATDDNHVTFVEGGKILSNGSVRHTASGISWEFQVTSTIRTAIFPLWMPVGRYAVNADSEVTVSLWMRRSNTGITGKLVCRGGQIAGVSSDVSTAMTASADTWEQVSIAFTPTEAGVVEIEVWAYGGTTYSVYVDDIEVSQA